jgi:hypothetical protein
LGTKQLHDGLKHCGSGNCREASAGIKTVAYRSRLTELVVEIEAQPLAGFSLLMPDGALRFLLPAGVTARGNLTLLAFAEALSQH